MLRIQARIPVVVMGETGCGKTSLVKFLSVAVNANFQHLDFHSGITDENIRLIAYILLIFLIKRKDN